MKRFLVSCILALLLVVSVSPATSLAQTPDASVSATPDPFALPVNLLVLRMMEGNGFGFMRHDDGSPVRENAYQINDGVVDQRTNVWVRDRYITYGVEDLYISRTALSPLEPRSGLDAMAGITIDTRLFTFPDGDAAARFVEEFPAFVREQADLFHDAPQDIVTMDDVPMHDQAIVGMTGDDPHVSLEAGDRFDVRVPFSRFVAQSGTTVASVKVSSLDPAFNDSAAQELLTSQLDCLGEGVFCQPVPVPAGIPFDTVPFGATPIAVIPLERWQRA